MIRLAPEEGNLAKDLLQSEVVISAPKSEVVFKIFVISIISILDFILLLGHLLYSIHIFGFADYNGWEVGIPIAKRTLYHKTDGIVLKGT